MATLDPEPFGKPTLLLGSSLLSDANETFTSNGLLDTGLFGGSGDSGEGENTPFAQSPSWTAQPDRIGSSNDDELSTFATNGLLDGPTQMTSTVVFSDHFYGVFGAHAHLGQTPSALRSLLGSHFSDSQTLVGSTFTQAPGLLSGIGYAGPSIRATTFEGKPVFIRKKAHVDRTKKVFGHLNVCMEGSASYQMLH